MRLSFISPPLPSSFLSSTTADPGEILALDRVSLLAVLDKYQSLRAIDTGMHVLGHHILPQNVAQVLALVGMYDHQQTAKTDLKL